MPHPGGVILRPLSSARVRELSIGEHNEDISNIPDYTAPCCSG